MTEKPQTFGDRIRLARKAKKLNQAQLGELLGISAPSVSAYETNDANPTMASLAIISKSLDVSIDWIVTGNGQYPRRDETAKEVTVERHDENQGHLRPDEQVLLDIYRRLNHEQRQEAFHRVSIMLIRGQ